MVHFHLKTFLIIFIILTIPILGHSYNITKEGDYQEAKILQSLRKPLQVTITDSLGIPVSGLDVIFKLEGESSKAYIADKVVTTDENGKASTVLVLGKAMGDYYVSATVISELGEIQLAEFKAIAIDPQKIVFWLFGGLGLFLFGMKFMSEGLQKVAGRNIKKILKMLTANRFVGVLVGTMVTAIIQSSSATTVMVVGFINAGLMNLTQAIGIILGANIGTTVTAQLISFKISHYALPAVGVGLFLMLIGKRKRTQFWGQVFLGFGLLFLGMTTMKEVVHPLRDSATFSNLFIQFSDHPILGVLVGVIITIAVQSSSATIGLTMTLAGAGFLDLQAAIPIILGDNIGTTVTAQLASIGGTKAAKRAAMVHTVINSLGTIYVIIFMTIFPNLLKFLQSTSGNIERQIANFHTIFNFINTIVFLPLVSFLRALVIKLIPGDEEEVEIMEPRFLEKHLLSTPTIALEQVAKEIGVMVRISSDSVHYSLKGLLEKDGDVINKVMQKEETVDTYRYAISEYIAQLSGAQLSSEESIMITRYLHLIADIERISDHAENIAFIASKILDKNISMPEESINEIKEMFSDYIKMNNYVIKCFEAPDEAITLAKETLKIEERLDVLKGKLRKHHLRRLRENTYGNVLEGVMFMDVVTNLERMGDHLTNIAEIVLEAPTFLYDSVIK